MTTEQAIEIVEAAFEKEAAAKKKRSVWPWLAGGAALAGGAGLALSKGGRKFLSGSSRIGGGGGRAAATIPKVKRTPKVLAKAPGPAQAARWEKIYADVDMELARKPYSLERLSRIEKTIAGVEAEMKRLGIF